MKRSFRLILLLCTIAGCFFGANAQFRYAGVAGLNLTTLKWKQDLVTTKSAPGMNLGVQGELMFPGIGFGIDIGLIYNMANTKVNLGQRVIWQSQGYGNELLMLHELNIPLHLRFKYTRLQGLEEVVAPLVFAGPEINFTVAHSKCDAMKYAGGNIGVSVGLGAEIFKRWQVTGMYTWGMTYALKASQLKNYSAKTRQWTIRLSYFF